MLKPLYTGTGKCRTRSAVLVVKIYIPGAMWQVVFCSLQTHLKHFCYVVFGDEFRVCFSHAFRKQFHIIA